jgi:diacylglycerol O-acyltransferase / wax synthase
LVASFERLSALDATLLAIDDEPSRLHFVLVAIFARGADRQALDRAAIRARVTRVIQRFPRFRRRLAAVPLVNHPLLVNDPNFDLDRHLKFVELSRGDDHELTELVARIAKRPLERAQPLWEQWYIDGLRGDRFAVVSKLHQALIGGSVGAAVWSEFMHVDATRPEELAMIDQERAPGQLARVRGECAHYARTLVERSGALVRELRAGAAISGARRLARQSATGVAGLRWLFADNFAEPGSAGPQAAFDTQWLDVGHDELQRIADVCAARVEDVLVAALCAALARYFGRHGRPAEDAELQALICTPPDSSGRVALARLRLPLFEQHPRVRVRRVAQTIEGGPGLDVLASAEWLADLTFVNLATRAAQRAMSRGTYDVIVTHVAALGEPATLSGAVLESLYPLAPLYLNNMLSVACVRHAGRLCVGLTASAGLSDLAQLTGDLRAALDELGNARQSRARDSRRFG